MRNIIVPALAALSLAAVSTPVSAETVSIDVEYADLNLSNEAGIAVLEHRIERAIDRICGDYNRQQSLLRERRRCVAQARASAAEQIARIMRDNATVAVNR